MLLIDKFFRLTLERDPFEGAEIERLQMGAYRFSIKSARGWMDGWMDEWLSSHWLLELHVIMTQGIYIQNRVGDLSYIISPWLVSWCPVVSRLSVSQSVSQSIRLTLQRHRCSARSWSFRSWIARGSCRAGCAICTREGPASLNSGKRCSNSNFGGRSRSAMPFRAKYSRD